jgi:Novel toxin 15
VTDSSGVKRTKLVTISFLCPANLSQAGLRGEFTKQVEGQQEGLNQLSVPEWFTNRSSFLSAGRSNSEQREYRAANKTPWLNTKATEIQTRPYTQELIVQLQKVLTATELNDLQDVTKTLRIPAARARTIAEAIWSQQAALHDPDQNAGGKATGISGLGDKDVNSSIGSQWKDRVYVIDREVAKIPEILRPDLKLNTRLRSQ